MIYKYLTENPLAWLLEENNRSVRYLTLRDILNKNNIDDEYEKLLQSSEILQIRRNLADISSRKNYDIFYKGIMWYFAELVARGIDSRSDFLRQTADSIAQLSQMPSGGFSINWNPERELSCRTGDMIRYFLKAGIKDHRVKKGIKWIVKNQRRDGGWLHCPIAGMPDILKLIFLKKSGKGLLREEKRDVKSCFYASIACLNALIEYNAIENKYGENIKRGAEFFLKHRMFLNSKNRKIKSKKFWNKDFTLLSYPVLSQYDILYGLITIAKAGYINDRRTGTAFNLVISKQNIDGTWNLENAQTGMLFNERNKSLRGKKNKWVTLNILRLLKLYERDETQLKKAYPAENIKL